LGQLHGVEVPVHTGAEMLAKKHDLNVIFMESKKA
jgi:KDO2-lipid IV(A) lauroyltransferase